MRSIRRAKGIASKCLSTQEAGEPIYFHVPRSKSEWLPALLCNALDPAGKNIRSA
jgi:hypothetical protein